MALSDASGRLLFWIVMMLGVVWAGYLCSISMLGTPCLDEVQHLVIARQAWRDMRQLLDFWGRPVNTAFYMLPSLGGLLAARVVSIFTMALAAVLLTSTAKRLGLRRLYLVPLMLWFQPWTGEFSFPALTVIPMVLFCALGLSLWFGGRLAGLSLCMGILPLVRHETLALTALWFAYVLLLKRKPLCGLLSVIPLAVYNLICWFVYDHAALTAFANHKPTDIYGQSGWMHYFEVLWLGVGWPVLLAAVVGCLCFGRRRPLMAAVALFGVYFLIHVVVYRFGLYASGGFGYFIFPVLLIFALCGALGAEWGIEAMERVWRRWGQDGDRGLFIPSVSLVMACLCAASPFLFLVRSLMRRFDWFPVEGLGWRLPLFGLIPALAGSMLVLGLFPSTPTGRRSSGRWFRGWMIALAVVVGGVLVLGSWMSIRWVIHRMGWIGLSGKGLWFLPAAWSAGLGLSAVLAVIRSGRTSEELRSHWIALLIRSCECGLIMVFVAFALFYMPGLPGQLNLPGATDPVAYDAPQVANWIVKADGQVEQLDKTNPWIQFHLAMRSYHPGGRGPCVVVWDHYWFEKFGIGLKTLEDPKAGWTEACRFGSGEMRVFRHRTQNRL